jgi:hypothetical protein
MRQYEGQCWAPIHIGSWKRVWRLGPVLSRLPNDMTFIAVCLRSAGDRRARASSLAGLSQCSGRMTGSRFAAVSIAPDRQPLTAPSGTSGTIEIEFAAEAQMRITGAVDAATLTALVAALQRQCWAPFQSPLATIGLRIVDIPCRGSTTTCWIGSICPLVCRRVRLERLLPLC